MRRSSTLELPNMAALDLFASALGAFIILSFVLMPYYLKNTRTSDIDLVFVMDTTGSMSDEIYEIKEDLSSVITILDNLSDSLNIGFVAYRDDDDKEYKSRFYPLSEMKGSNKKELLDFVNTLSAKGGDDIPEALDAGVISAINMSWREDNQVIKLIIVIGDAPPHEKNMASLYKVVDDFVSTKRSATVSTIYTGVRGNEFFSDLAKRGNGSYMQDTGRMLEKILLLSTENTDLKI